MATTAAGPTAHADSSSRHTQPSTGKPTRLRLVTWAASKAEPLSLLPTLDPDGLFAASVVQARRGGGRATAGAKVDIELQAPSTVLHDAVPCLEDTQTGVILAGGIEAIESYSWKLAGRHGERSLLHDEAQSSTESEANVRRWARAKALDHYLTANLHPLVHQALFARTLFRQHTAKAYTSGLGVVARQSIPARLRRTLQGMYAAKGLNIDPADELGPILCEDNTNEAIERQEKLERRELMSRAGFDVKPVKRSATGLLLEEKREAGQAFRRIRMLAFAEQVLSVVADSLGEDDFLSAQQRPGLLDLRVFSLLAPLLLPADQYPALAASPLPTLLRSSFPRLVEHSDRVRTLLWPIQITNSLQGEPVIETLGWLSLPGTNASPSAGGGTPSSSEPLSIRLATTLGRLTNEAYMFSTRLVSNLTTPSSTAAAKRSDTARPTMTPAEQREARMVRIGRYAWIATSVVVVIATAFTSGLVQIEWQDEDEIESEIVEGDRVTTVEDEADEEEEIEIIIEDEEDEDEEVDDDDDEEGFGGMDFDEDDED